MTRKQTSNFKLIATAMLFSSSLFATESIYAQCTPTFTFGCDLGDQINNFTISGEDGTVINEVFTGCSTGAYKDATGAVSSLSMTVGGTYSATISTNYYEPDFDDGDYAAIWIDFNDDGLFEISERVATSATLINTTGTTITLNIPTDAASGNHTMRVMVGYNYNISFNPIIASDMDPCNTGANEVNYGEVHDYTINVTPLPLSVKLIDFVGNIENATAHLNWTTVNEENNRGFKILKSKDGISFDEIGWIESKAEKGILNGKIAYTFNDQLGIETDLFYKLVQVGLDDKEISSNIIHLQTSKNQNRIVASPNPAKNSIIVSGPDRMSANASIIISDISGSILQQIPVNSKLTTIDISGLNSGLFLIKYQDNDYTETIKVSKL